MNEIPISTVTPPHLFTSCEVCGKRVFVTWFAITGDRRTKCGECARPRRAEVQRAFPDHDPGDEDRSYMP